MKFYNFWQQCKDHFATVNAKKLNRIPFATLFLKNQVLFYWPQHKQKLDNEIIALFILGQIQNFFWS